MCILFFFSFKNIAYFLLVTLMILNFGISKETTLSQHSMLKIKIIKRFPHLQHIFTQGLIFYNDKLYESSGLYQKSSLFSFTFQKDSLKVEKSIALKDHFFAEGITIFNKRIYLLTWKEKTLFIYDLNFNKISEKSYQGEGWGITHNDKYLIMSNGSHFLFYRDPNTFKFIKKQPVTLNKKPINFLNELEYVDDFIYANVWQKNIIIKISAKTGEVTSVIDAAKIAKENQANTSKTLNGIAYNHKSKTFYLTGKMWEYLYEVRFISKN